MAKTAAATAGPRSWFDLLDFLKEKNRLPPRVLLYGPPGTGKSLWAHYKFGHSERITLHGSIDPADLLGTWILQGEAGATSTVWGDGPASRALRHGRPLVLDEIAECSPEAVCNLYALTDDPPAITLPTGERLTAKEGYQVFGTTNEDPNRLPPALLNRFEIVLHAATPAPGALAQLPSDLQAIATNHYGRLAGQNGWKRDLDFRTLLALQKIEPALGLEEACRAVFGSGYEELAKAILVERSGTVA